MKKLLLILVLLSIVGCKTYQWDDTADRCRNVQSGEFAGDENCK